MLQFNFKLLSVSADKAFHTFSGLLKAGREHPCHRIGFLRPGKQQRGKKYEPVYVHKNCSSICDITLQGLSFPAVCPCSLQHFSLCLTLEKCSGRIGTKYKGWQQGVVTLGSSPAAKASCNCCCFSVLCTTTWKAEFFPNSIFTSQFITQCQLPY